MAINVYFGAKPLQYFSELQMQTYQPTWIELSGVECLEDFEITFRKANADDGSNNVTQESISKELNFFGPSYNFLHDQLVVQKQELVYVKVEDDCPDCGLLHFGIIKRKNLKNCDCDDFYSAQINGISKDEIIKARLESILAYNDLSVTNNENCLFECVQETLNRQNLDNKYGVPAIMVRSIFESFESLLSLNSAYSSIFFDYNRMMDWTGDDYAPTVTPLGQNVYNPYFYTTVAYKPLTNTLQKPQSQVFAYQVGQGSQFNIAIENRLSWSAYAFLNRLSRVFNSQWRVKDGNLEFERKDYFMLGDNLWLDVTSEKTCYNIEDFGDWAYLDIGYGGNRLEVTSSLFDDNVRQFFLNSPLNVIGSQIWNEHLAYQDDLISFSDELSFVKKQPLIKKFEFGYHPILRKIPDKLGLKDGVTNQPLLLIKRQNSAINRAFPYAGTGIIAHQPMTVSKYDLSGVDLIKENLYDNFHFIDNPNQEANSKGYFGKNKQYIYSFTVEEVPFNCTNFDNFDINKTVNTKRGLGIMEEVTFNWSRKTVTIEGRV